VLMMAAGELPGALLRTLMTSPGLPVGGAVEIRLQVLGSIYFFYSPTLHAIVVALYMSGNTAPTMTL
jgi:hypothetical protein